MTELSDGGPPPDRGHDAFVPVPEWRRHLTVDQCDNLGRRVSSRLDRDLGELRARVVGAGRARDGSRVSDGEYIFVPGNREVGVDHQLATGGRGSAER